MTADAVGKINRQLLKQRVLVVYVINRLTRHLSVLDVIWIG
ncbi:hypothetical protein [Streptomyces sp. NPDC001652]